jgi:RimJ/RimL family protein N-acetyltransferase
VPAHRGHGYASALARRVVDAALDDGLVAQWRCRLGNKASERLAERIGFARVGQQTAVLVDDA